MSDPIDHPADPFEVLRDPTVPREPRPSFARALRARVLAGLDVDPTDLPIALPTVPLPDRRSTMTTTSPAPTAAPGTTSVATPYLTVAGADAAIAWYVDALGATEAFRVVADDGVIGHAELDIGGARIMLSDEHPAMGVVAPTTLGGTAVALHLEVPDVDARFARAVAAGATALQEPADQPHGSRHGSILDPYGHRWMLSQTLEELSVAEYADRASGSGYEVVGAGPDEEVTAADRPGSGGGIWAEVSYVDALAGIRFLVDVFGFEEQLVVVDADGSTVVHSQLRWPEGGIVQVGTQDPDNVFIVPAGEQSLYVITADPMSVWDRCQATALEVIRPPEEPGHDPGGIGFSVRDPEGNIWSFGTYGG